MQETEKRIQWVYGSTNNQELEERYDQWAADYDQDLEEHFMWLSPRAAVSVFTKLVPNPAKVLDAGAGTGLVGELLADLGYRDLVAIDLSQGMLDEARSKNVYSELHQMGLRGALGFRQRPVRRGCQRRCIHPGARPGQLFRRVDSCDKARGLCDF